MHLAVAGAAEGNADLLRQIPERGVLLVEERRRDADARLLVETGELGQVLVR
ncbi:MAG: hypothetical protein HYR63_05990 [Proteobacteria bacterium]|nr:hypothetical protein [Pseudomonadota bacterium]